MAHEYNTALLRRAVELSGELDIGRTTGADCRHGSWYAFTWISGYVYGRTVDEALSEVIAEAEHNSWNRLPVVQVHRKASYIKRMNKRRNNYGKRRTKAK